jgi:hypothetical protein
LCKNAPPPRSAAGTIVERYLQGRGIFLHLVAESPRLLRGGGQALDAARDAVAFFAQALSASAIHYSVSDLPAALPTVARKGLGLPLLTWTVRTADQRRTAERYADQMIFEGFRP